MWQKGVSWVHIYNVGPHSESCGTQGEASEGAEEWGLGGRRQTADTNVYTAGEAIIIQPINADRAFNPLPSAYDHQTTQIAQHCKTTKNLSLN